MWPAALFLWGRGSWSDLHRHHSVQLVMALSGRLRFREKTRGPWTSCAAVLVRPDARHEVDARGTDVVIGFVDAESDLGAALLERSRSDVSPLPSHTVSQWRSQLKSPVLTDACVERWVWGHLLQHPRRAVVDPRVRRVLQSLPSKLADADTITLHAVADSVKLSPSRFLHVFTKSVGIPLRPYILWLRLQCAARELARGRSVTDAGHTAGFADAAHFARTFRRMLGATPRQVLQRGIGARDFRLDLLELSSAGRAERSRS
jgi:AraC-like DNA-binding protein